MFVLFFPRGGRTSQLCRPIHPSAANTIVIVSAFQPRGRHAEEESLALKSALSSANARLAKLESLEADAVTRAKEIQVGRARGEQDSCHAPSPPRRHLGRYFRWKGDREIGSLPCGISIRTVMLARGIVGGCGLGVGVVWKGRVHSSSESLAIARLRSHG